MWFANSPHAVVRGSAKEFLRAHQITDPQELQMFASVFAKANKLKRQLEVDDDVLIVPLKVQQGQEANKTEFQIGRFSFAAFDEKSGRPVSIETSSQEKLKAKEFGPMFRPFDLDERDRRTFPDSCLAATIHKCELREHPIMTELQAILSPIQKRLEAKNAAKYNGEDELSDSDILFDMFDALSEGFSMLGHLEGEVLGAGMAWVVDVYYYMPESVLDGQWHFLGLSYDDSEMRWMLVELGSMEAAGCHWSKRRMNC